MHMVLHVCVCVHECVCVCMCEYGGQESMLGFTLHCSSPFFIEAGSLPTTWSLWLLLDWLPSLLWEILCPPF